jgi:isopentenyldiphosphate isomerase
MRYDKNQLTSNDIEYLSIVDENDNIIGKAPRTKIHEEGLLHREIHVWFVTQQEEIIFQHRAIDKDTYPDLLDATVGGHVEIGDSYYETALKEMEEETGVHARNDELHLIGKFKIRSEDSVTKMINNTFRVQYAFMYKGTVSDLRIEEGKAIGFEAWSINKLSNLSDDDKKKFISFIFSTEMLIILRKIKKLIHQVN